MGEGLLHSSLEVTSIILNMITFQNQRVSIQWDSPHTPVLSPRRCSERRGGRGFWFFLCKCYHRQ